MTNGNQLTREEQAWLVEYQACQQYISERSTSYWTLTGIFIGFSSVLLGGLIYGLMSNNVLLKAILSKDICQLQNKEVLLFGVITYVISIAVLLILFFLKRWEKRVTFLQQINFHRMRDIERALGMWASWRVHGVDNWRGSKFDREKIKVEDRNRLLSYQPRGFWQYWRDNQQYERPSSKWHYNGIFYTLIALWAVVLASGLYLFYRYHWIAFLIAFLLFIFICVYIYLEMYQKFSKEQT